MAKVRLDKLLAHMGHGSRKDVKDAVKRGRVTVDGAPAQDPGQLVDPQGQSVSLDGEPIAFQTHFYFMLHKPAGVLTATEDRNQRTVLDLIEQADRHKDLYPVGRLDKDTEGLLLLTTDGQLGHRLLAPRRHVPKLYFVRVEGRLEVADVEAFRAGIELDDGYRTMPATLQIEEAGAQSTALVTIEEGKFHQIKRMFADRGKHVLYLKRLAMGPLELDAALPAGKYRPLLDAEVAALYEAAELPVP